MAVNSKVERQKQQILLIKSIIQKKIKWIGTVEFTPITMFISKCNDFDCWEFQGLITGNNFGTFSVILTL